MNKKIGDLVEEHRREKWTEHLEKCNLRSGVKRLWNTIKKLSGNMKKTGSQAITFEKPVYDPKEIANKNTPNLSGRKSCKKLVRRSGTWRPAPRNALWLPQWRSREYFKAQNLPRPSVRMNYHRWCWNTWDRKPTVTLRGCSRRVSTREWYQVSGKRHVSSRCWNQENRMTLARANAPSRSSPR